MTVSSPLTSNADHSVFQAITGSASDQFNRQRSLPSFIHQGVSLFQRAHLYYATYKGYQLVEKAIQQPNRTGNPIVQGVVLEGLSNYTLCLRIVLITKCTEDLLGRYFKVSQAYEELKLATQRKWVHYEKHRWSELSYSNTPEFSASLYLNVKIHSKRLFDQIKKILHCTGLLLQEMFLLSMEITDTYLIANGDALTRQRAFTDLVANWHKYESDLTNDNSALLQTLEKTSELSSDLMKRLNMSQKAIRSVRSVQTMLRKTLKQIPAALQTAQDVLEPVVNADGKIVPIDAGFEVQAVNPQFEPGPHPPWTGQRLESVPVPDALRKHTQPQE